MFRIADGREHFYQWDVDRQILVNDSTVAEVHFCNRTDDCSLVVKVINGVANVPNIILQKSFDVRVFGYDGKATRYDEVFKVKARSKPTDYVYTEVEISRYEDLSNRIDEIEKNGISQEAIDTAIGKYLEENPIAEITKVSELENDAGYATETYVDNAIDNIPEVDLSQHALKSEVPTKVSQLQNDSKFITREDIPSEYITESELAAKKYLTSIPSEYVTENELAAKKYATETYVDNAIANIEIPEDSGDCRTYCFDLRELTFDLYGGDYAKATANMAEFATRVLAGESVTLVIFDQDIGRYLPAEFYIRGDTKVVFTRIISHADAETQKTLTQWLLDYEEPDGWCVSKDNKTNITRQLATTKYVDDAIAGIEIPEGESTDLSNYYTKTETDQAIQDALNAIGVAEGGAY